MRYKLTILIIALAALTVSMSATAAANTAQPRAHAAHQATCNTYWFDSTRGFYRKPRVLYHYCVGVGGSYAWIVVVGYSFKHYVYLGHHWHTDRYNSYVSIVGPLRIY